ncbi:MFS transporter [Jatrophihabitans sp. DSM 45814]
MAGTFASLHIRNFRLYLIGMNIAFNGLWMLRAAQAWLVLELTHSGVALGLVTALTFLPIPIVGSWSGVLADRYPKRNVIYTTTGLMGSIAFVMGVLDVTNTISLWQVYILVCLFGIVAAVDTPTRLSFVVEMVGPDALANSVALNSASVNAARLIGPAIAGQLIATVGTGWVILTYSVAAAVAIGFLSSIRKDELQPVPLVARAKGQFSEGIRYVRGHAELRLVFVTMLFIGTFATTQDTLLPLMATDVFDGSARLYGLLTAALAAGTLTGALVAAKRARADVPWFTISCFAYGAIWLVASVMPTVLALVLVLPILGMAQMSCITGANAIVQLSAVPEMRGRVMALYMTALLGGAPAGALIAGWLSQTWTPRLGLATAGVMSIVAALLGLAAYRRVAESPDPTMVRAAAAASPVADPAP